MVKLSLSILALASVSGLANAHAGPAPVGEKLARRREHNQMMHRSVESKCGAVLAKRRLARMAKRELASHPVIARADSNSTSSNSTDVCILTPEVTQGPYHILGELVRQNITQNQAGIPMELDIDFIDIETCNPVPNVWVDGWSCNATGYYSGYISLTGAALTGGVGGEGGPNNSSSSSTLSVTSPTQGADPAAAAAFLDTNTTDDQNFLRGVWQADTTGHLTMHSILPGWYTGRAVHFHIKVYPNATGSTASNGSFVAAGSAVHTGQFFFSEDLLTKLDSIEPYSTNQANRTLNSEDQWFPYENAVGYDALMNVSQVSDDLNAGIVASLVVGLNLSYSSVELSSQWWDGEAVSNSTTGTASGANSTTSTSTNKAFALAGSWFLNVRGGDLVGLIALIGYLTFPFLLCAFA